MTLQDIIDRRLKIDGAPWTYYQPTQWVMGKSLGGCNKEMGEYRVADIRGWGHLQYMGIERGDQVAKDMQDANGIFIANAPSDVSFLLGEVQRLRDALGGLIVALAENDEDGLTEFAEPMCAARAAFKPLT